VRGAVLAGGAASRFDGRPKGLEKVGGTRILDRVVDAVSAALGAAPLLVANHPDAQRWRPGLTVGRDARPGCGSLGGIYSAIAAADGPVLVAAWDMPFLTVDFLAALVRHAEGYDVFLPESDGPLGVEPLCGVYGPSALSAIASSLDVEDYRATGFHDRVRVGRLPLDQVRALGDPGVLFFNVNHPSDLATAETLWRERRDGS
jgi:molybdopterin-guanine dinucleotide biosynthesis protein A